MEDIMVMLLGKHIKLDRGSIRSSPRDGLSTPYTDRLRSSVGLFHHFLVYMWETYIPALNLSILDADNGATSKIDE